VQKATSLFGKGKELYQAKKYAQALDNFKQSYALVPSPNSHLYIARCLAATGELRAAWLEFDRTIDEATAGGAKYAPTLEDAKQDRDDLGAKLALVVFAPPDGATKVRVGGYEVPRDRWGKPFPVEPTTTDVIVEVPGQPPVRRTVTFAPGERRDVRFDAPGPVGTLPSGGGHPGVEGGGGGGGPATGGGVNGLRIGAYVAGGVGVIGLIMFAAEGAAANSTYSSLQTLCNNQPSCPTGNSALAEQKISSGKSQQAVANAGVAIGVIGVAAGVTLFVLSTRKKRVESGLLDHHPAVAEEAGADFTVEPGWLGARGAF
jgi:hypothetical protein